MTKYTMTKMKCSLTLKLHPVVVPAAVECSDLLHGTVVDTSVVFPHRLGPPHKLTLNKLTAEYLRRIIQESVCGHDTADDAAACMELMLWKLKESGKLKK